MRTRFIGIIFRVRGLWWLSIKSSIISTLQMSCQYVMKLVNLETTYSWFGRTHVNIIFWSLMNLKVVDLDLLLTFDHMWKILVWLLGLRFGFVNDLISSESSTCIYSVLLAILIVCPDLKIWVGNFPTNDHFDCTFKVCLVWEFWREEEGRKYF